MHPRILFLSLSLVWISSSSCTETATTLATLAAYDEIAEDQEPKSPSKPILGGMIVLIEPCEFEIGIASSDPDGFIVSFRQTGGSMPPGYSTAIEDSDPSSPGVYAMISGPPVSAGSWTAYFVAVDNEGRESPVKDVPFICGEKSGS